MANEIDTLSHSTKPPLEIFQEWYDEAVEKKEPIADRMTLATVDDQKNVDARIVLIKQIHAEGVVFYTNYKSQKAKQIAKNSSAALVFYWPTLGRQVRMRGKLQQQTKEQNEAYFVTRPRLSQIGAWASNQSEPIESRSELEKKVHDYAAEFEQKQVPCPDHWGGYLLVPNEIEFWEDRDGRLHDRLLYRFNDQHQWFPTRLSP